MNIIGFMVPKLVTLMTILIPSFGTGNKLILVVIWLLKCVVDYDVGRPGHSGNIYKLTQGVDFEVGELIVAIVQFIPTAIFLIATIVMRVWISFIPGVIAAIVHLSSIICCIKDAIVEGKRRKERKCQFR